MDMYRVTGISQAGKGQNIKQTPNKLYKETLTHYQINSCDDGMSAASDNRR